MCIFVVKVLSYTILLCNLLSVQTLYVLHQFLNNYYIELIKIIKCFTHLFWIISINGDGNWQFLKHVI